MLESALKLSNSKMLLAGAVVTDTVCMGTLALMLTMPMKLFFEGAPAILLASLAITAPFLACIVAASFVLVPKHLDEEERGRRAILGGTVMHMGIQLSALIGTACGCGKGPATPGAFVMYNFAWAIGTIFVLPPAVFLSRAGVKRWGTESAPAIAQGPPPSVL